MFLFHELPGSAKKQLRQVIGWPFSKRLVLEEFLVDLLTTCPFLRSLLICAEPRSMQLFSNHDPERNKLSGIWSDITSARLESMDITLACDLLHAMPKLETLHFLVCHDAVSFSMQRSVDSPPIMKRLRQVKFSSGQSTAETFAALVVSANLASLRRIFLNAEDRLLVQALRSPANSITHLSFGSCGACAHGFQSSSLCPECESASVNLLSACPQLQHLTAHGLLLAPHSSQKILAALRRPLISLCLPDGNRAVDQSIVLLNESTLHRNLCKLRYFGVFEMTPKILQFCRDRRIKTSSERLDSFWEAVVDSHSTGNIHDRIRYE